MGLMNCAAHYLQLRNGVFILIMIIGTNWGCGSPPPSTPLGSEHMDISPTISSDNLHHAQASIAYKLHHHTGLIDSHEMIGIMTHGSDQKKAEEEAPIECAICLDVIGKNKEKDTFKSLAVGGKDLAIVNPQSRDPNLTGAGAPIIASVHDLDMPNHQKPKDGVLKITEDSLGAKELSCKHIFHNECINEWFKSGRMTCPVCRAGPNGTPATQATETIPFQTETHSRASWRNNKCLLVTVTCLLFPLLLVLVIFRFIIEIILLFIPCVIIGTRAVML